MRFFVSGDYTTGFIAGRLGALEIEASPVGGIGGDPEKSSREVEVEVNGKLFRVRVYSDEQQAVGKPQRRGSGERRAAVSEGAIAAPMQGTIVRVLVEEGQEVEVDDPVCVLEAMKMESEIRSRSAGTVSEVHVEAGQTVRPGEPLITIE